ncbi:MAG: hypothetical protein AB1758_23280 [Candidatus Eremiobacterota bacterium]
MLAAGYVVGAVLAVAVVFFVVGDSSPRTAVLASLIMGVAVTAMVTSHLLDEAGRLPRGRRNSAGSTGIVLATAGAAALAAGAGLHAGEVVVGVAALVGSVAGSLLAMRVYPEA